MTKEDIKRINSQYLDDTESIFEMEEVFELAIKALEPKMGHWITTRTFMHDGEFYCDKCNCDAPHNEKWDYCPNCGAKMVELQKSEDKR